MQVFQSKLSSLNDDIGFWTVDSIEIKINIQGLVSFITEVGEREGSKS